jgi:hypothetical protein
VEKLIATIRDGDTILAEGVDVWIESGKRASGLDYWEGRFSMPDVVLLPAGGPFRLDANDGRSGDILISDVEFGRPTQGRFRGTGGVFR